MIWIERRPGAVWAVGRAVNPQLRDSDEPRPDDLVFEGFELEDALDRERGLEDDVSVLEGDGRRARSSRSRARRCCPSSSAGSSTAGSSATPGDGC